MRLARPWTLTGLRSGVGVEIQMSGKSAANVTIDASEQTRSMEQRISSHKAQRMGTALAGSERF